MFVYMIVNKVTGKHYIGQHKGANLKQYLQKKFWHAKNHNKGRSHLFSAMRKYPNQSEWEIIPLVEGIDTKEARDAWERALIELFDSRNPEVGYNICAGGEGTVGLKHTEEWKQRHSAMMKELHLTDKWIEMNKRTGAMLGKWGVESGHLASVAPLGGKVAGKITGKALGTVYGQKNKESGHIQSLGKKWGKIAAENGQVVRAGKIAGEKAKASGQIQELGRIWGKKRVELLAKIRTPEHQRNASLKRWKHVSKEERVNDVRRRMHIRWHLNRNIVKPDCKYCESV